MHSHPAAPLRKRRKTLTRITVACYYFPNYHTHDRRNDSLKGDGWAEWELVKKARPCFDGQQQPKVPAWGYTDEKDPAEMARKIDAAADNGVDVFIFDWYYYDDGPFLNRALDEGFLKAPNTEKLKFALMWANHDWLDIHPYTKGDEQKILYPGRVTPETFDKIGDLIIKEYFTKPNYWTVDGKPYFSVYDVQKFVENFGSVEAAAQLWTNARKSRGGRPAGSSLEPGNVGQSGASGRKSRREYARTAEKTRIRLGNFVRLDPPHAAARSQTDYTKPWTTISRSGTRRGRNTASVTTRM